MATLDDVMDLLRDLADRVSDLEEKLNTGHGVVTEEGLSDIDDNLGLIVAGELRFGRGVPGHDGGFSGIRIKNKNLIYGSTTYVVVGVSSDAVTWGIRSCDGTLQILTADDPFAFNIDYENNIINLGSAGLSYPAVHNFMDLEQIASSDVGTPGAGYGRIYVATDGSLHMKSTNGADTAIS